MKPGKLCHLPFTCCGGFRRADALRPGSYEILSRKAQQIVGGPSNSAPVDDRDPAVAALASGRVDIVIGYCTSANLRQSQMAELQVAEIPREIAAGPEYGLAVLTGADPRASDLALFMLSPDGQQIFARYGFAPITLPAPERRSPSLATRARDHVGYRAARSFASTPSASRTQ
jgi:ABC-type Fe3+ transport system substrate-binding protein